jgi:hypothetical protein
MDYPTNTLLSLLRDLKNEKTDLTREGQSFSPASLFSAIQVLINFEDPCSSPDFLKIRDISTKLTNVNNLIEFCETILRKIKSTEEPFNPNEKTFLDYIYMVSQILGMTLEIVKIQESTNSIFSYYKRTFNCLSMRISERFKAVMIIVNSVNITKHTPFLHGVGLPGRLNLLELKNPIQCKSSDFIKIENLKLSLLYNTHKQC